MVQVALLSAKANVLSNDEHHGHNPFTKPFNVVSGPVENENL